LNIRNSFNITDGVNGLSYSCQIKVDEIYNLENELIYVIEHIIDRKSNYNTLNIYNNLTKQQLC
jgi:hypothetical protein